MHDETRMTRVCVARPTRQQLNCCESRVSWLQDTCTRIEDPENITKRPRNGKQFQVHQSGRGFGPFPMLTLISPIVHSVSYHPSSSTTVATTVFRFRETFESDCFANKSLVQKFFASFSVLVATYRKENYLFCISIEIWSSR